MRDEGLVLEVGIPLLPTRGKGKPIVTWSLDDADRALAEKQRARLSVLARPNMNGKDDEVAGEEKSSPVTVQKAHLAGLDVRLAVAPTDADSPIRSVGAVTLVGDVTYATDESTDGLLRYNAEKIDLGAIDAGRFSVTGLRLDAASDVEIGLHGVTPVRAKLVAQNVSVDGLHVTPSSLDARGSHAAGGEHSHASHAPEK